MPEYEFFCVSEGCEMEGKVVLLKFHMVDIKEGTCESCNNALKRKFMDFTDQYKGDGFTRSADAKEERDVWKAKGPDG